jgi:shikimate kinase
VSGPHLVLVGMMGSGKTVVGARASERLGWPFIDVDHVIVAEQGQSIGEIFGREGEPAFRRYESAALREVLAIDEPTVVCTGGGAVLDPDNRSRMHDRGTVVWLKADPAVLARRLGNAADGRPLLRFDGDDDLEGPSLVARLQRLCDEREGAYREAADRILPVDELSVDEAAEVVANLMNVETEP